MQLSSLKNQLIEVYSHENLNNITTQLIAFNKQNNTTALKKIALIVNNFTPFDLDNLPKLFPRLLMLYHPDKLKKYQQTIISSSSVQELQELMHIIQVVDNIQHIAQNAYSGMLSPNEFEAEYGWNYQSTDDDYYVVREDDETMHHLFDEENPDDNLFDASAAQLDEFSFLGAVKRKIYGPSEIIFPVNLLEDMEDIEMAEYEIENLDGIEFCTYLKILDLSHNQITDIRQLVHCEYIQELYLTDNEIYSIDGLASMNDLRLVDLSHNRISNISVLYNLPSLEFVNLLNNKVSQIQIDYLSEKGVVVVS